MPLGDFLMENPLGLPSLPHLRRQISSRIGDYSGKTSSLYLRQARQSLSLGYIYMGSPGSMDDLPEMSIGNGRPAGLRVRPF